MYSSAIPASASLLLGGGITIVLSYVLWRTVRRVATLGVVQMLVSIAIGPGVLGAFCPQAVETLFPSSASVFEAPGWLAVALFTFVAGGQSRLFDGQGEGGRALAIAAASLTLPLAAGTALGLWFYESVPALVGSAGYTWTFSVGIGLCIATTALPVLALILSDMGLLEVRAGREAIVVAVISDVTVWCILGIVVSSSKGAAASGSLGWTSLAILLALAPIAIAAGLWRRRRNGIAVATDASALTWSFASLVFAGVLAETIGMHFAIGSFFAGLLVPRAVFERAVLIFEPFCLHVALPFFFLSVSAKLTPITEFNTFWLCFVTMLVVSILTKFAAACGASLLFRADLRESCLIGALAQCKGMMEIVALKMLYDAHIISSDCLAPLLAMAMFTTFCCKPFAMLFLRDPQDAGTAVSAVAAE
ncbi:Kef-type K+ transport system membrane component KefB [Bradyrhizobium sp. USDA 4369]